MQPDTDNFIQTQHQFSGYLRDPDNTPAPEGIEPRRMKIYTELFYNNVEGFAANAFPVLRELTSDAAWHEMIRDFMIKHHCQSPLFHEISREFLTYLNSERDCSNDPVFIKELAHYEWVELALSFSNAEFSQRPVDQQQDCLELKLTTSPLAWPLSYHYPVHQISTDFQPEAATDPVYLLVYRDIDDRIGFIELNPVSAKLIDLLNQGLDGYSAAQQIAEEMQHPKPEVVINGARELINDWLAKGILF